ADERYGKAAAVPVAAQSACGLFVHRIHEGDEQRLAVTREADPFVRPGLRPSIGGKYGRDDFRLVFDLPGGYLLTQLSESRVSRRGGEDRTNQKSERPIANVFIDLALDEKAGELIRLGHAQPQRLNKTARHLLIRSSPSHFREKLGYGRLAERHVVEAECLGAAQGRDKPRQSSAERMPSQNHVRRSSIEDRAARHIFVEAARHVGL